MVKGKRSSSGGRGSAEAIEKRRVARQLNALFGADGDNGKRDGRTEKRRLRLLKELKEGRAGKPLKPIEVITHADELLSLGETLSSIRKNGVRALKNDANFSGAQLDAVRRAQSAYGFRPEAWKLLGVDVEKSPDDARGKRRRGQRG